MDPAKTSISTRWRRAYQGLVYARDPRVGSPLGANLAFILRRSHSPGGLALNAFSIAQGPRPCRIERATSRTPHRASLQAHDHVERVVWASLPGWPFPQCQKSSAVIRAVLSFEIAGRTFVEA